MFSIQVAFAHITAALTCLLFVESLAEWIVQCGIAVTPYNDTLPTVAAADGIDLASSLYKEYISHFSHLFTNLTEAASSKHVCETSDSALPEAELLSCFHTIWEFIKNIPLITTTMELFDLPGSITQNHQDMW